MLIFGVDVVVLCVIATLCVVIVTLFCWGRVTEADGRLAVASAVFTSLVMLIGYVIMARVLDNLIGINW